MDSNPRSLCSLSRNDGKTMLDAAINAIVQMFSAPLRAVLWKTIGLALVLIIVAGAGLERLIVHLIGAGGASIETTLGPQAHEPVFALAWLLSVAAGFGIVAGSVMLMPAVTAIVGSFFADQIGDQVERKYYPADAPGRALPLSLALWEGIKTSLLAVVIYLCTVPLMLLAGFGAVIFFLATAYILGREYFELAAMRLRPPNEAKALRKRNAVTVFIGGLFIAAFVSIPVVNLATPLFAMALMVHLHKRLSGTKLIARA
jgi:CysZ protein